MAQHNEHSHHGNHQHSHDAPKKKIHHDWRFWAVILMLGAMLLYVVTNDEAVEPGGQIQQEVPADAE
jgi:hypothetical protein